MESEKTILLLDDDPVALNYGKGILQNEGYRVIPACNALQGKAILDTRQDIDMVVTDNQMPGMTGLELAEILYMEQKKLPMIMASSDLPETVIQTGQQVGIRGFLEKPYSKSSLSGLVRTVISNSG